MFPSNTALPASVAELRRESAFGAEDQVVALFDELRVPLLRYLAGFPLSPQDSEDAIQEAFLALFQLLHRGGASHPNLRGWLFRTSHNLALKKRAQARKDSPGAETTAEDHVVDPAPNPEAQFAFQQTQQRLQSVVRALPEQSRWCLYLRAEGLRYREIAEVLDISLGSVSLCLERALTNIARAAER